MISALLKFLLGLFGIGNVVKDEVARGHAVEEGSLKQANVNQKMELEADEKEIADMRAEKDFADFIARDPAELERMRRALNADAETSGT